MNYRETLYAIDTVKALGMLEIPVEPNGKYAKFPCPTCQHPAASITTFGEKKNLWYCPKCKTGGNLIKLAMSLKHLEWEPAKEFLKDARSDTKPLIEPVKINYDLEYTKVLEELGAPEALCKEMGIGQPKGRTMLAGCTTFAVHNEVGTLVAFYGLTKDRKPKFHSSFNPELYLYNLHRIDRQQDVILTTNLLLCLKAIVEGKQAVSTFMLPYLSPRQLEMIGNFLMLTVFREDEEIVRQVSRHHGGYVRFIG